ncbi:hypothetical protein CNEO4_1610002 [Clostridium neonatale]|nr:hypothetical protein CNEO4_1610002 [Clostridium neonatale]CAI3628529.1 hypothetical protein CNEO4_1850009 [Clostridium neonatale]
MLIDDVHNEIISYSIRNRCNISDSKLSDSEKTWFFFVKKNFKALFPNICDRTLFNRTKRNLFSIIN